MQQALDALQTWTTTPGFTISKSKTEAIVFSRGRLNRDRFSLQLGDHPLQVKPTCKILGLLFDQRHSWKDHITNLKVDCKERLDVIKVLTASKWEAEPQCM